MKKGGAKDGPTVFLLAFILCIFVRHFLGILSVFYLSVFFVSLLLGRFVSLLFVSRFTPLPAQPKPAMASQAASQPGFLKEFLRNRALLALKAHF